MLFSTIVSMSRALLKRGLFLILTRLPFLVQSVLNMSVYVCKICEKSSDEILDFILCKGNCRQYLHYSCANIAEDRFRNMSNRMERKWKCKDCRIQRGLDSPETKDLDSENDSGNSLSSDIRSVEDVLNIRNGDLPNTVNELNALRQELSQTVQSLEQLRTEYNQTDTKLAAIERQMAAQVENLNKVSVDVRDTNKMVYTLGQNVRNNRLEIHGLNLGAILTVDFQTFDAEIKRRIVSVGECFGVGFSVEDIDKVDILKAKKNFQRPILLVHFFSKAVRDMLIAARKKIVINANLPGSADESRIYINENLSSYYNSLWYEARQFAKRKHFTFVWIREGKLFVKKDSGSRKIHITCKEDLDKLEADYR